MAAVDMAVNSAARLWTPFKELYDVVDTVLLKKQLEAVHDLEVILRRHKPDFLTLLKSPPKNSSQREMVKKATKEGLPVYAEQRTQTLSQDFIDEALIFSDLFNINEFAAVEFLLAGQNQQPNYPGLGRGLVAVLLYYDGQRALVNSLHVLLQAREGRMWTMGNSQEVTNLITGYTDQLIENGLVERILGLVKAMDLDNEVEKLEKERALGPPKHRKQVIDLYKEIRLTLAECIFSMAAQQPLNEADTLRLITFLREDCKWNPDGTLEPASLCLLITLLYCFDNRLLEHEDKEEIIQKLPMVNSEKYVRSIHQILVSDQPWSHPGIKAVACFAWALSLRQLYISQHPCAPGVNEFCEDDENIVFSAIKDKVFSFLRTAVLAAPFFFEEEFYVGRLHGLLTDFIIRMPLKVTELRNLGDEAARIIMVHLQNGKEPPSSLSRDFEELLKLLAELYGQDKLGLEYGLEYWCPAGSTIADGHLGTSALHHRPPQRQVALYKFVRLAGDLLPTSLYVPYIQLLIGLANSSQCAWHCFSFLKMNGMNSGSSAHMVSWDHIFLSLNQYYTNLRRELPSQPFGGHHVHGGINPQEQEALISVLKLTECIAKQNQECRIALYENQQWMPTTVLFGLVGCSIPARLKAQILLTLSALGKSREIASSLWQSLEASQIVATVPSSVRHQQIGGIQVELEEIESRNEEYNLTRDFLTLINTLINSSIPQGLGAGYRTPGFGPYLDFIIDSVLLKCLARAYKKPAEKWQVAVGALEILYKILCEHKIQVNHFVDETPLGQGGSFAASKPPGHTLMILMLNDSGLLRLILQILNDALLQFSAYIEFPGKALLEKACLLCLRLIEITLEKEDEFLAALRESGSSTVVVCMDRLLRSVNPSTGKPDHLVNIAKFVLYNDHLYEHALSTMKILFLVCRSASVQSDLVALFTANEVTHRELLQGFVECLENDEKETNQCEDQEHLDTTGIRNAMRKHLMQLLLNSLDYPAPNVAHFLMGFDLRKPVSKTNLQDPGVLGCPRTCLHSLITILNCGVGTLAGPRCIRETPQLAELAYHLIYALCSNKETSPPTMRYLRTVHDFFYRHLKHLPFTGDSNRTSLRNHQSWLLKAIAIELRLASLNRHRSHTQRLMKLLLEDIEVDQISAMQNYGSEENDYTTYGSRDASLSQYPTMAPTRMMTGTQTRRKILRLLDSLDFTSQCPQKENYEFFEQHLVEQVIKSCSKRPKNGPSVCDVKALHHILIGELNNLQGTMAGQRVLILREVEQILEQVVARNNLNENLYSKAAAFESWRQVIEVLVTTCSHEVLDKESQQTLLFELLQDLLIKVADTDTLEELTSPVAGVVHVVMANLRRCFMTESLSATEELQQNSSQLVISDSRTGTRTLFATSLHIVLKGILDYIQKSCGSQQKVRIYLYGALLYYLQIAQKPVLPNWLSSETDMMGISKVLINSEGEFENLSRENLSIIMSYSDNLFDILCKDTCDGHHVGRLLSLSVLDCILALDKRNQCLNFMIFKGYLQHLISSILSDDPHLQNLLNPSVDSIKYLYSFEGRMTFFNRVASSPAGAYSLLRHGLMQRLAECEVFSMRPEHEREQTDNILSPDEDIAPSPLARYRRLLFAVLKLCLAIISSVGVENSNITKEILMFIISHADVFHAILRDRHTFHDLEALQELQLTTAVISKVAVRGETDQFDMEGNFGETTIEFSGQISRLQREMFFLLQRFVLSEKVLKELHNLENKSGVEGDDLKAEISLTYKKIITNVVAYCRLLITKSGQSAQFGKIIFGPSLEERNPGQDLRTADDVSFSYVPAVRHPLSLTIILQHLKQCTSQFMSVYDNHQQLKRKLNSITDLTSEDLKEYSGVADIEKIPTQQQQELAKRRLVQIIGYRFQELHNYSYIIENCLFILWRHLEYYLLHCVPTEQQPSLYQAQLRKQQKTMHDFSYSASPNKGNVQSSGISYSASPNKGHVRSSGISSEELETLKCNAPSVIGDSLMKKILEINQCFGKTRSHYSFVEAVVRQIRRLLRLHTSNSYEK